MASRAVAKEVVNVIYVVRAEVQDKVSELELSWVGELTKGRHEIVPRAAREAAERQAEGSLKEEEDGNGQYLLYCLFLFMVL